jgi:hypothetical protein
LHFEAPFVGFSLTQYLLQTPANDDRTMIKTEREISGRVNVVACPEVSNAVV